MRRRLYPETMPVLASYWLKTVYAAAHDRAWWKELDHLLQQALAEPEWNVPSSTALTEIQTWIQQSHIVSGKAPHPLPPRIEPRRANFAADRLAPYLRRLFNEWLPAEIASLLVEESDPSIPVLAVGKSLERLLIRERLSSQTLEMLLQPGLLSPRDVYPAEAEMFVDIVLALLGRTDAPQLPVLPAILLPAPPGSTLPADFANALRHAALVPGPEGEQVQVPIHPAQARQILETEPVHIASLIVTLDGRCWESDSLQSGEQNWLVYKPAARLRLDYSADHAKLRLPWPDTQINWQGTARFPEGFEIFGRQWRATSWETDDVRTWLNLVFLRVLPAEEVQPAAEAALRRSHPASVDMAWAALENALVDSLTQKSCQPVEQLHRSEFIPLGRSILGLIETMPDRRLPSRQTLETHLASIRYLQSQVSAEYGRVPWRILPAPVQATLLRTRSDVAMVELLTQVFDGFPVAPAAAPSQAA
jgi:hypothetical protein